jgi:hypothetical protein
MKLDWGPWLYGLVSGFIGGGAGAVSAGFAGIYTDPQHFNPANGLRHLLALMGITFIVTGGMFAMAYLAKSPLPQPRDIWTEEQRAAHNSGAATAPKP